MIPVEMVLVSGRQFVDRVLEDLSPVNLLLQSAAGDEPVHDHIHRLSDAKSSIHRL